jgi:signal transduction histidine kinase
MLWMLRGVPGHLPDLDAPEPVPARVRLPVRWPAWADVPLAVAAVGALDGPAVAGAAGSRERLVIAAAAAIALPALVLCRRRAGTALALAVASLVGEVLLLGDLLGPAPFVAALAALAALAAQASARRSAAGTGTAAAAIGVVSAVADGIGPSDLPVLALFFGIAFAAGRAVRTQRLQAEALRVATRRLTRERDARARLAVAEERIELARELHDSVAHAVSVMVLQAAAAEQVLDSAPELARRSVRAVQDLGRRAIEELQRLVGMLRDDHDRNPRAPHAQLAQLEALIAQVSEAGLIVDLEVKGERVALSPGLDAAAYRIVQESLTNALKHAGRVRTRVRVRYGPDVLRLEIVDDGHSRARPSRGPGHGLIGMRERAALYGGTLRAGPRRGGGYAVSARLPLTGRRT